MQILDPDILELTRQLSPFVCVVGLLLGLFLWWYGAYCHRFWLALTVTLTAGVVGLQLGRDFGVQPLVAGMLFALAAGALALALARISLFLAGGVGGLLGATRILLIPIPTAPAALPSCCQVASISPLAARCRSMSSQCTIPTGGTLPAVFGPTT